MPMGSNLCVQPSRNRRQKYFTRMTYLETKTDSVGLAEIIFIISKQIPPISQYENLAKTEEDVQGEVLEMVYAIYVVYNQWTCIIYVFVVKNKIKFIINTIYGVLKKSIKDLWFFVFIIKKRLGGFNFKKL